MVNGRLGGWGGGCGAPLRGVCSSGGVPRVPAALEVGVLLMDSALCPPARVPLLTVRVNINSASHTGVTVLWRYQISLLKHANSCSVGFTTENP